jgi:hypothetical protein
MADSSTAEYTCIPDSERAETYTTLIDQVQRFSDEQWRRSQAFEARAMQLMASSAVMAGVTFTFTSRSDLPTASVILFTAGIVVLIASLHPRTNRVGCFRARRSRGPLRHACGVIAERRSQVRRQRTGVSALRRPRDDDEGR